MQKVELNQLSQELRRAVEGDLAHDGAKLLGCTMEQYLGCLPDMPITVTQYRAYTQDGSVLIERHCYCENGVLEGRVYGNLMTFEDIQFFLENSDLFKR